MVFVIGISIGVVMFILGVFLRMAATTGQSGQRWKSVIGKALITVTMTIIGFIIILIVIDCR